MKTLATHPELVRAWLLAQAGMPLPPLTTARSQAPDQKPQSPQAPVRH
ncbi:hypothetical protein LK542_02310 [Massilia sp. IC2-477]|nr:hypothetical protein [Massilia sp. IC2-477]MCC2954443.1 hypothetical protein [Massilia sp. IC2-477]